MHLEDGRRNRMFGKKGSFQDIVFVLVVMFVLSVVVLIGYRIAGGVDDQIQSMASVPAEAKTASTELIAYYPTVIDNSALIILIFLAIMALVLAALVRVHPIFIPIYLVFLTFIILYGGIASNIYEKMAEQPDLTAYAANLNIISSIMLYLPIIIGVIGILMMIVLYKSYQAAQ